MGAQERLFIRAVSSHHACARTRTRTHTLERSDQNAARKAGEELWLLRHGGLGLAGSQDMTPLVPPQHPTVSS